MISVVVPGVKPVPDALDTQDDDIGGEGVIDTPAQRIRRQVGGDVKVRNLRERVDARVRPA